MQVEPAVARKRLNNLHGANGVEPQEQSNRFDAMSIRFDDLKLATAARQRVDGQVIPGVEKAVQARLEPPSASELNRRTVFINDGRVRVRVGPSKAEVRAALDLEKSRLVSGRVQRIALSANGHCAYVLLEKASDAAALAKAGWVLLASGAKAVVKADDGRGATAIVAELEGILRPINRGDEAGRKRSRSRSRSRSRGRKEPRRSSRTPPRGRADGSRARSADRGTRSNAPPPVDPPSVSSPSTSPAGAGAGSSPASTPTALRPEPPPPVSPPRAPPAPHALELPAADGSEPPRDAGAPAADASLHELQLVFRRVEEQLAMARAEAEQRTRAAAEEVVALRLRVAELERERGALKGEVRSHEERLAEQGAQLAALQAAAVPLEKYDTVKAEYWADRERAEALEARLAAADIAL